MIGSVGHVILLNYYFFQGLPNQKGTNLSYNLIQNAFMNRTMWKQIKTEQQHQYANKVIHVDYFSIRISNIQTNRGCPKILRLKFVKFCFNRHISLFHQS
jgi:hypothetical protein